MRFLSVAFGLPYLLIELFDIGMPVVRTEDRVGGRSVCGHVITKFSRMGSLPHFFLPMVLRSALRARELRYNVQTHGHCLFSKDEDNSAK